MPDNAVYYPPAPLPPRIFNPTLFTCQKKKKKKEIESRKGGDGISTIPLCDAKSLNSNRFNMIVIEVELRDNH
jgi:hypothetical protein